MMYDVVIIGALNRQGSAREFMRQAEEKKC